jgi:hypothetical protein
MNRNGKDPWEAGPNYPFLAMMLLLGFAAGVSLGLAMAFWVSSS